MIDSASVARVREALVRAGVNGEIVELPGAARTARQAADFLGCEVAQIANSLVFRAQSSERAVLVMSSGANRVDTARLSAIVGEPVGHTGEVLKFVDRSLGAHPVIWAAAGHPHTVFRLTYAELLRITAGAAVDVAATITDK